jgi:hypothetical protein
MASFDSSVRCKCLLVRIYFGLCLIAASTEVMHAQQQQGFAVERFYPSAPGAGWFVMDDLTMDGTLGGAIELTGGYSQNPWQVTGANGTGGTAVVSAEAFVNVGLAATHDRYRAYLNIPMPLLVIGTSGAIGPYSLTAPAVNVGTNPDTISDPRLGFDVRFLGTAESALRLGGGAQLIFPSGHRTDYVTDARYRGMLRFLAAGDVKAFSFAGQLGYHARSLSDLPALGGPNGSEFLFGGSAGRKFSLGRGWQVIAGPEIYGETAFRAFFNGNTGAEALMTGRFETISDSRRVRIKIGVGHAVVEHFGAAEWRVLFGADVFGQTRGRS